MLRIANSDVTGDAFTKSEFAEKPKRCSESLFAMLAFVFEIVEGLFAVYLTTQQVVLV